MGDLAELSEAINCGSGGVAARGIERRDGVLVWLTPNERAAVENLLKQAMRVSQLQTTFAELEREYGEL